jgi:hypothetical protein
MLYKFKKWVFAPIKCRVGKKHDRAIKPCHVQIIAQVLLTFFLPLLRQQARHHQAW